MADAATYTKTGEPFERDMNYLPDRVLAGSVPADPLEGAYGANPDAPVWPVEPGRYRLVAAKACPWANRAIIVRNLLLGCETFSELMDGAPGSRVAC